MEDRRVDRPSKTIAYADHPIDPTGIRIVSEAEAFDIPDIDVGFVETGENCGKVVLTVA